MTWILFTMLYSFMPNTRVRFRSALIGGVLEGTLWEFAKYGYTVYTASSVQYNAIYGSLGALPIFLIWLYLTWVIVLIGAEVSFADQNIKTYRDERRTAGISQEFKEFLALNIIAYICSQYDQEKGAVTASQIGNEFNIPIRLVREVLYNLCAAGILLELGEEEHFYCPAIPLEKITVKSVLHCLKSVGEEPPRLKLTRFEKYFKKVLEDIDGSIEQSSGKKDFKEILSELARKN